MSRAGFALFVGWLTEGTGAEGMGIGEGIIEGGREGSGRRARMSVLTVVNGRLKFHGGHSTDSTVSDMSLAHLALLKLLLRQLQIPLYGRRTQDLWRLSFLPPPQQSLLPWLRTF